MPDLNYIRLYMFEGLPVYTDVLRENDLLHSHRYVNLRTARQRWRRTHSGCDPRYMILFDGVAFGANTMTQCPHCHNQRPRVGDMIVCLCVKYQG